MKTKTKALVLSLCAVLLVAVSVFTTIAFLKSRDSVNNTFTVGKVAITLDEAKVDGYGNTIEEADRVKANTYKLIPGHEYTKDPIVHFAADSEASYLFVKIENGLADIEADTKIADQIKANDWTALDGVNGVYYKTVSANNTSAAIDYPVFESFKLTDDAVVSNYANAKINVTAYAIQADGFTTATTAWAEASK
mgnify:CR=1 FL=1